MLRPSTARAATVLGLLASSAAWADWSTDPSVNTPIAVAPNDTVEPKVV